MLNQNKLSTFTLKYIQHKVQNGKVLPHKQMIK